jgi:hypothetical protein
MALVRLGQFAVVISALMSEYFRCKTVLWSRESRESRPKQATKNGDVPDRKLGK